VSWHGIYAHGTRTRNDGRAAPGSSEPEPDEDRGNRLGCWLWYVPRSKWKICTDRRHAAIVYLCSKEARWITGVIMPVDAGVSTLLFIICCLKQELTFLSPRQRLERQTDQPLKQIHWLRKMPLMAPLEVGKAQIWAREFWCLRLSRV